MRVNMIDEATLATMLGAFLWLVYHCREWKKERAEFAVFLDTRIAAFGQMGGDLQEVLEDILDGLQGQGPSAQNQATGGLMPQLLTAFLNNQMTMPSDHGGTQRQTGQISEEVEDAASSETEI